MEINLSKILDVIPHIDVYRDSLFNSFSLTNGKLKNGDKLIVYVEDKKYVNDIFSNKEITCVICTKDVFENLKDVFNGGIAISNSPRTDFFMFHNYLNRNTDFYNKSNYYIIDSSAYIHNSANVSTKNVKIGKNTKIHANVTIYENTIIGDNVIIREGSVIGNPAFYYYNLDGRNEVVDSVGGVVIEDNVEIHSNVVVCKGTLGASTIIRKYTKIDSLVFIAHDVVIGENCLLPAGTTVAGIASISDNTFIGIGSNIVPSVNVGRNCKISAGSVVTKDINDNKHVSGNFAISHDKFINFIKKINGVN